METKTVPTVLMVDDDVSVSDGVRRTLRREPYHLVTATSGEQALEIIAHQSIDVIVSDEHMPGMGGLELLTEVHAQHPHIVSIMLSGQSSMGTVVRALNVGQIYRFLIKPCLPDDLIGSIRRALAYKLMLDRCRLMLPLLRRQALLLQAVEQHHPGLLQSLSGNVVITPEEAPTETVISDLIDVEIRRSGG